MKFFVLQRFTHTRELLVKSLHENKSSQFSHSKRWILNNRTGLENTSSGENRVSNNVALGLRMTSRVMN